MNRLGVAHFGSNGHTVIARLQSHPRAQLLAVAAMNDQHTALARQLGAAVCSSFEELLAHPGVDLIVLCSPRRADQVQQTIAALQAGKHVYAEKPSAMSEADLDRILQTASRTGCIFHEMAGTVFQQPYLAMRKIVLSGRIGQVTQVLFQKSYPYHDRRPQDETIDGGLILQVGVHAFRMVEHITGLKILDVQARQTKLGNPQADTGQLRMAAAFLLTLSNGALAAGIANYFNPHQATGVWGYEGVRVFGTQGLIEANPGGSTRLYIGSQDLGPLDLSEPSIDYFDLIIDQILDHKPMPLSLDEELHPTRMIIRARENALTCS